MMLRPLLSTTRLLDGQGFRRGDRAMTVIIIIAIVVGVAVGYIIKMAT